MQRALFGPARPRILAGMKAVVQRVARAEVAVGGETAGRIGGGLLVYVGMAPSDTRQDARKLADKVANLRIFHDAEGRLNRSVRDIGGEVLAVPNFTLQADARKGRRPALNGAARPTEAQPLFEAFVEALGEQVGRVEKGVFGAEMRINSTAEGPVNILLDMPPPE